MKIDDASQMTGYAVATIYDLAAKGKIPCIKLSRKALRFDRADIERWIESHRKGASPEATPAESPNGGQGEGK